MSPTKSKTAPPKPADDAIVTQVAGPPVPTRIPNGESAAATAEPLMPTLNPPGTVAATLAASQAATAGATMGAVQAVTIGSLWTSNDQSNSWAYLNGIGWRHISSNDPGAHHALVEILRLARDANVVAHCDEDGATIHGVTVF